VQEVQHQHPVQIQYLVLLQQQLVAVEAVILIPIMLVPADQVVVLVELVLVYIQEVQALVAKVATAVVMEYQQQLTHQAVVVAPVALDQIHLVQRFLVLVVLDYQIL